jgi:FlaA1/EpsC-like NDP-sugar epimerase
MRRIFGRLTSPPPAFFCIEFLLIGSAVLFASMIRFGTSNTVGSWVSYVPHAFLTAFIIQLCMYYADLYDLRVALTNGRLFIKILQSLVAATIVLTVVFYCFPQLTIGRGIMLLSLPIAFSIIVGWRLLYQRLQALQQFKVKLLIVGTGEEARKLAGELLHSELPGYEIKGFIGDTNEIGKNVL